MRSQKGSTEGFPVQTHLQIGKARNPLRLLIPGQKLRIDNCADWYKPMEMLKPEVGKLLADQFLTTRPKVTALMACDPLHPYAIPFPLELPGS